MTSASESRKRRLNDLQYNIQRIARDVQDLEADGRIEAADITRLEQIVASLDDVVSSGLPRTRVVQRKKFLGLEFAW